jgi:hypothetical protein
MRRAMRAWSRRTRNDLQERRHRVVDRTRTLALLLARYPPAGALMRMTDIMFQRGPKENAMSDVARRDRPAKRRSFLSGIGKVTLSAAAVALLAGREHLALIGSASAQTTSNDVTILNAALGAEQEAIAAYQLGAESGLLQKPVLDLAVQFQGHHKAHADALSKTVQRLGGTPVVAQRVYSFPK